MHADIVPDGIHIRLAGIDDVVDLPLFHQPEDLIALGNAVDRRHVDAESADGVRRSLGRIDVQTEIAEFLRKPEDLKFILVVYGEVDAHFVLFGRVAEFESRRNEALEEGFFDRLADAENFARRLHFRPELRVHVVELLIREHRNLHRDIRRSPVQSRPVTEFFQFGTHDDLRGKLDHRHSRHLGNIRYGTRSAGIDLDDIQLVVIDEELYIDQPLRL